MKEILCCGVKRKTPFCPTCGLSLQPCHLSELLNYLRSEIKSHGRQLVHIATNSQTWKETSVLKKKMTNWAEALEKVMIHAVPAEEESPPGRNLEIDT